MPMDEAVTTAGLLVRWEEHNARQHPWRATSSPYQLAVAEVLLQKTKATDVEPVWHRLVARFNSASDLAEANDDEVLGIAGCLGLGLQRTRRLKMMARAVERGEDLTSKIPGLGPYGSAIVLLSLGLQPRSVPVDGNVARVICRHSGFSFDRGEPRKKPEVKRAVQELMDTQRSPSRKLAVIYALVDLAEGICKPRMPSHLHCPLLSTCLLVNSQQENDGSNRRAP